MTHILLQILAITGTFLLGFLAGKLHAQNVAQHISKAMEDLKKQMEASTGDLLRQRQQELAQENRTQLSSIVHPLHESLQRMQQAMHEDHIHNSTMKGELKSYMKAMMEQSERSRTSTEELTRALKFGSKVQGDWGETILSELLDSQGLTQGVHYETQALLRDEKGVPLCSDGGSRLRPDVILHLDQKREVVIDSKVSLSAYMDYVACEDGPHREALLKAHVSSIQKHVRELAEKDYSSYIRPPKERIDFVIMFVPHSAALWTALHAQPDLWRQAMEKNVFIADEQTLFAALRIIHLTWVQIRQQQNHEKVFGLAEEMMNRVGIFTKKFRQMGLALQQAQQAYDEAGRKLAPQGQSILQTCRKFQQLGVRQNERNPLPDADSWGYMPDGTDQGEETGEADE